MPQLTLCFKEKIIDIFLLDETTVTIGRDVDNTYMIDSLAIAERQFKITINRHKFVIENLSDEFPASINGNELSKTVLQQGDKIALKKHTLVFSETNINTLPKNHVNSPTIEKKRTTTKTNFTANLQVIKGADIGRVIPLNKAVTEINTHRGTSAIIAKRHSGYFISRLIDDAKIQIDGSDLTNELLLTDGNLLTVDDNQFAYFTEE